MTFYAEHKKSSRTSAVRNFKAKTGFRFGSTNPQSNPDLKTDDQAVDYIHRVLDRYDDLSFIRGIHLHESLSGPVIRRCMEGWHPTEGTYQQRMWEVMGHIFEIDTHQPFRSPRIREILERVCPDYLVWEQISATRADHARTLAQQQAVLTGGITG